MWHRRALPDWCKVTDGDWFEQRVKNGEFKSVAYIETIQVPTVDRANENYPLWSSKRSLCLEIERKMGIPAYIVWHNAECNDFMVQRISETTPKRMSEEEYKQFIENL
jgi:hypothetical protein